MADEKLSIEKLQAKQESLQEAHDRAQGSFQGARAKYAKAKQALVDFNFKYGRMLKLVVVDPEAEEVEAEAVGPAEPVAVAAEDPAGEGPFEDPADTTNEE